MESSLSVSDSTAELDGRSKALRRVIVEMMEKCGRGHVGAGFSLVEILRVLYDDVLKFDPARPKWSERDRCILSKGHGCLALWVMLAEKGYFPQEELFKFCKTGALLGGHPEITVPGVEASTGALGHGLPIGVGMALNARIEGSDYRTFVVVGDGECNEGSIWEAALCAAKHKLSNLTVLVDYNKHQSYGLVSEVCPLEPFAPKWEAFGCAVREVDGHDVEALRSTLAALPFDPQKPSVIVCHTHKGRGTSLTHNNMKWHHKTKLSAEEVVALYAELEAE